MTRNNTHYTARRRATTAQRFKLSSEDPTFEDLEKRMLAHFKWPASHSIRDFQMDSIKAILCGQDVLVHAGTGSGKTMLVAGPLVHESSKDKVVILVSPLIALQEEQVETFKTDFAINAVAVNSTHDGCTTDVMADICRGKWQVVIISPEMLLSKRFIAGVLRDPDFRNRVLMVAVDEAHVVSHWGEGFRKKFGELGITRALLPPGVPMLAMSATLPDRVRNDVLSKLQYSNDHTYINVGNDRPNVSLIVRAIHHSLSSYRDLDFVIPTNVNSLSDIPKTFIYADNIVKGIDIEDHLRELLPHDMQTKNLIQTYSSAYSNNYRREVMQRFKAGAIRVLVCTDAAGMGCNIPDIDIVVQWKLPGTVSSFVQRAGRAARAPDRQGLAVLLAEKSAYTEDLRASHALEPEQANSTTKRKARKAKPKSSAKDRRVYAEAQGLLRGSYNSAHDANYTKAEPPLNVNAPNEGLYTLVQTGVCRRKVLTTIYCNASAVPTGPCCDLCNPELLDDVRPSAPQAATRHSAVRRGVPCRDTQRALHRWRTSIYVRDFEQAVLGPSAILKDETIEVLSSVGPIKTKQRLAKVLSGQWAEHWFERYGDDLWSYISNLDMPPFVPKPAAPRGTKRVRGDEGREVNERESNTRQSHSSGTSAGSSSASTFNGVNAASSTSSPSTAVAQPVSTAARLALNLNPYAALVIPSQVSPPIHPSLFQPTNSYPTERLGPAPHSLSQFHGTQQHYPFPMYPLHSFPPAYASHPIQPSPYATSPFITSVGSYLPYAQYARAQRGSGAPQHRQNIQFIPYEPPQYS